MEAFGRHKRCRLLKFMQRRCASNWIVRKEFIKVRQLVDLPDQHPSRLLTEHLRDFLGRVQRTKPDVFWHRKSDRVVLAMLHVEIDGTHHFVPGMNAEVSLPTGSICAERAAIVSARSLWPPLQRRDIQGIAVVDHDELRNPLPPCGACNEWLEKIQEESQGFRVLTYSDLSFAEVRERYLFKTETEEMELPQELGDWICLVCDTWNQPRTKRCKLCGLDRFTSDSLERPSERRVKKICKQLVDLGAVCSNRCYALPEQLIQNKGWPKRQVIRWLEPLVKAQLVHELDGRYSLTDAGLKMVGPISQRTHAKKTN